MGPALLPIGSSCTRPLRSLAQLEWNLPLPMLYSRANEKDGRSDDRTLYCPIER